MDIKKNITLSLSIDDIKNIITDYLKREGHDVNVEDITFVLGVKSEGYGLAEHDVIYFDRCDVKL